jgi:RNA polymerase sigma-70 factor (ECF subfamily)
LNRTYALSKVKGKREAICEAEKLNLTSNHFYFTLLGELYTEIDNNKAKDNFKKRLSCQRRKPISRRSRRKLINSN